MILKALLALTILFSLPQASLANAPSCQKLQPTWQIHQICHHIAEQNCHDIPERYRFTCGEKLSHQAGSQIVGCLTGVFKSAKGFVEFLYTIAKFVVTLPIKAGVAAYDVAKDPNAAVEKIKQLNRAQALSVGQLKGYIAREYAITEHNMGLIGRIPGVAMVSATPTVIKKIATPLLQTLASRIEEFVQQQVHDFSCYNVGKRMELMCHAIADFVIPPSGLFSILKGGGREVLQQFPNIAEAISKISKQMQFEKGLVREVNVVDHKKVSDAVAKDLHENWRTSLSRVAQELHPIPKSDFLPNETAESALERLEKKGIKGLSIDEDGKLVQNINHPSNELLPSLLEKNNGEPARQYVQAIDKREFHSEHDFAEASSEIHKIWMKNNSWQREKTPALFKDFKDLSPEEQLKDLDVVASTLKNTNPKLLKSTAYQNFRKSLLGKLAPSKLANGKEKLRRLVEKPLNKKEIATEPSEDFSRKLNPEAAAQRYHELGLRLDNGTIKSISNSNALTRRISDLEKNGVEFTVDSNSVNARINGQNTFLYWSHEDFLSNPKKSVELLDRIKGNTDRIRLLQSKGFKVGDTERTALIGGRIELLGDKYGDEVNQIIYNLRVKKGVHVDLDPDLEPLGQSEGGGTIALRESLALDNPQQFRSTLLHESKHASTDKLEYTDREIWFVSPNKKLGAAGYDDFMRADEVEARLTQIPFEKSQGVLGRASASVTRYQARKMIDVQENILSNIKPSEILEGKVSNSFDFSNSKIFEVVTTYKGEPITIKFPLKTVETNPNVFTRKLISKRLKYLKQLKSRLKAQ